MSLYRSLVRHTSIYAVAIVARRLSSLFLLPIYTQLLTPADYGVLELLEITSMLMTGLIGGRLCDGLMYFYAHASSQAEKDKITKTALLTAHAFGLFTAVAGYFAAPAVSRLMFQTPDYAFYFRLVFLTFAFTLPQETGFGYLRAENRSTLNVSLSLVRLGISIAGNIIFLVFFHMGIRSILYSALIASGVLALYLDFMLLRGSMVLSWNILVRLCRYSFPLGFSAVVLTIIHSGDRFFLQRYATLTEVGLYALAYKIGTLVGHLQAPFETYWDAQVFHVVRERDGEHYFVRILTYFVLAMFGAAVTISLVSFPAVRIFTGQAFHSANILVPVIAFAYAIRATGDYFRSVFAIHNRPSRNLNVAIWGGIITVAGYALLIPPFRAWGAAYATLIGFMGMSAVSFWESRKLQSFDYEWKRLIQIGVCSAVIVIAGVTLRPASLTGQIGIAVAGTLAFPLGLYAMGFFHPSERAILLEYARTFFQRLSSPKLGGKAASPVD